jgi:hypothetical protein
MKKCMQVCAVCLLMTGSSAVFAVSTMPFGAFDVTFYNAGESDGFQLSTQNWTTEQMMDVGAGVEAWSSGIINTPGRQVRMSAYWQDLSGNTLGGSGGYRIADGTTIWNLGEFVWREGYDPGTTPLGFDTAVVYDTDAAGVGWNFGEGSGAGIDFRSVAAHEVGHSLGWSSSYDETYDDFGWFGNSYEGLTAWDKNLVDDAGNKPLSGGFGTPGNFNELDNPVYWDGLTATGYYGDNVPVFAPDPWEQGSSLSHLDEAILGNLMMSPYIGAGQMNRTVSGLEWGMMEDMGWNVVAVPIPGALVLAAIGFGSVGWLRQKRMV